MKFLFFIKFQLHNMHIHTDITNTGLVISFKENYLNPINKEIHLIGSTCKISKEQIDFLLKFNVDIKHIQLKL